MLLLLMLVVLLLLLVPDDSFRFRLFHLFRRISDRAAALIGRVRHVGGEVLAEAVPHVLRSGDGGGGGGGDLAVFGTAVLLQMAPCRQGLPALGTGQLLLVLAVAAHTLQAKR